MHASLLWDEQQQQQQQQQQQRQQRSTGLLGLGQLAEWPHAADHSQPQQREEPLQAPVWSTVKLSHAVAPATEPGTEPAAAGVDERYNALRTACAALASDARPATEQAWNTIRHAVGAGIELLAVLPALQILPPGNGCQPQPSGVLLVSMQAPLPRAADGLQQALHLVAFCPQSGQLLRCREWLQLEERGLYLHPQKHLWTWDSSKGWLLLFPDHSNDGPQILLFTETLTRFGAPHGMQTALSLQPLLGMLHRKQRHSAPPLIGGTGTAGQQPLVQQAWTVQRPAPNADPLMHSPQLMRSPQLSPSCLTVPSRQPLTDSLQQAPGSGPLPSSSWLDQQYNVYQHYSPFRSRGQSAAAVHTLVPANQPAAASDWDATAQATTQQQAMPQQPQQPPPQQQQPDWMAPAPQPRSVERRSRAGFAHESGGVAALAPALGSGAMDHAPLPAAQLSADGQQLSAHHVSAAAPPNSLPAEELQGLLDFLCDD